MPRNRVDDYYDELLPETPVPNKRKRTADEEERIGNMLFNPGDWFRIPCALVRALNGPNAIMLAFLISQSFRVRAGDRTDGKKKEWRGWFYCTTKQMEKYLGVPRRTQFHTIRELKRFGFIETDRRGVPAKRYFKIVWSKIIEKMDYPD